MYARHSAGQIHATLIQHGQELGFDLPRKGICSAYTRTLDLYTFANQEKIFYSIIEAICNWSTLASRLSAYLATHRAPLTAEEMMLHDINNFFATLAAFMNHEKLADLLPKPHDLFSRSSLRRFAVSQNRHLAPLATRGGVRELIETGSIVTLTELQHRLDALTTLFNSYHRDAKGHYRQSITTLKKTELLIEICANDHAVSLRYSPNQRRWKLRDSNSPFARWLNPAELATAIFDSFNFAQSDINQQMLGFTILVKSMNDNPHMPQALELCQSIQSVLRYESHQKNRSDANGISIMHIAAKCGDHHLLSKAAEDGADLNTQMLDGKTPLHVAILYRQITTIEFLLKLGACTQPEDVNGIDAIGLAASCGNTDALEFFSARGFDLNRPNKSGTTPLLATAITGLESSASTLIRLGVDLNSTNSVNHSALHIAIMHQHHAMAELLIDSGIDINIKTIQQNSAVHLAAERGALKTLLHLLRQGASITVKNIDDKTPLDLALQEGQYDCAAIILAHLSAKYIAKKLHHLQQHAYSLLTGFNAAIMLISSEQRKDILEVTLAEKNAIGLVLSQAKPRLSINGILRPSSLLDTLKNKYASDSFTHQTQRILQPL
jgi:ankyrin repeat protein